jgi:hypothetical protein
LVAKELGNCPRAIFDLLSETTALKYFEIDDFNSSSPVASAEMARAVAGGFAQNTSLHEICLSIDVDYLGIVISGIGRSSVVESLTVRLRGSAVKCYSAICNMLPISPSLKKLTVSADDSITAHGGDESGGNYGIAQLVCALREPGCAGLEKLVLVGIRLGTPAYGTASSTSTSLPLPPPRKPIILY